MARHSLTTVILPIARAGVFAAALIGLVPHAFAACASPAEFGRWLQGFKKEAVGARHFTRYGLLRARRAHLRSGDHRQGSRARRVRADLPAILRPHGVVQSPASRRATAQEARRHLRARSKQEYGVPGPGARRLLGARDRFRQGDGQHGDAPLARHAELRLPASRGVPRAAPLCASRDRARRSLPAGDARAGAWRGRSVPVPAEELLPVRRRFRRQRQARPDPQRRRFARLRRQLSQVDRLAGGSAVARAGARAVGSAVGPGRRHHQEAARILGASTASPI